MEMKEITYFSEEEACELHLFPGITVVVPTFSSPPRRFALGILSLLANSPESSPFDHLIVTINGPDSRTGDTSNQDTKQKFLEEIRLQKYRKRDMPLTVQRVWSRLGHGESVDSAISWVHTKNYVLMHDDVLICDDKWADEIDKLLSEEDVAWVYVENFENLGIPTKSNTGSLEGVTYPHPNGAFLAARKSRFHKFKWAGLFSQKKLSNMDFTEAVEFYKSRVHYNPSLLDRPYPSCVDFLSYDVGSFILTDCLIKGQRFVKLEERFIVHKSWPAIKVKEIEDKIKQELPNLYEIYQKFFTGA